MYWILGLDFKFIYWILGVVAVHLLILYLLKTLHKDYQDRIKNGRPVYFIVQGVIPKYSLVKKIMSVISICVIIFILSYFIITKDKLYRIKVDDLNMINYDEFVEVIKEEFDPDDGKIYYSDYTTFSSKLSSNYNITKINIELYIIKNNYVYYLDIYSKDKSIIIHEHKLKYFSVNYLKNRSFILENDNFLKYLNKLDINHIKSKLSLNKDDYIRIVHQITYKSYYTMTQSTIPRESFFINKDGTITKITEDIDINSTLYDYYIVYKFEKSGDLGITVAETIDYFIEK